MTTRKTQDTDRVRVERLAYLLWQERGCPEGSPDEDWFRAKRELGVNSLEPPLLMYALGMERETRRGRGEQGGTERRDEQSRPGADGSVTPSIRSPIGFAKILQRSEPHG